MTNLKQETEALLAWVQDQLASPSDSKTYTQALQRCRRVCKALLDGEEAIPARIPLDIADLLQWVEDQLAEPIKLANREANLLQWVKDLIDRYSNPANSTAVPRQPVIDLLNHLRDLLAPRRPPIVKIDAKANSLVQEAEYDRSALLHMMAVRALIRWMQASPRPPGGKSQHCATLIGAFGRDRRPVPPGLMPDREHPKEQAGGYAASAEARSFFEGHLAPILAAIDSTYGTGLRALAPPTYQAGASANMAQWGLAWTQATVAVATDWLFKKAERGIQETLTLLMTGGLKQFRPNPSTVGGGTLPTDRNLAPWLELWAQPLLCQVLQHDPALNAHAATGVVHLSVKGLARRDIRGKSYATGRDISHLYLAVWIERFSALTEEPIGIAPMDTPHSTLPAALARDVAPGQHATVGSLIERIDKRATQPLGAARTWFAPPQGAAKAVPPAAKVIPLDRTQVAAMPASADWPNYIGSVKLDWNDFQEEGAIPQWMDLALVVRYRGEWHAVPLTVEEDEEDATRVWLSVDPALAGPWTIADLRHALDKALWAYRRAGLGIFVAGAIDLDGKGPTR